VRRILVLLLLALLAVLAVLRPRRSVSAPATVATVPDSALRALREGRYLRASLVSRGYLRTTPDTSAAALLLSAQAEAGWGDWEQVRRLLRGREWLDTVAAGHGWELLGRSQLELGLWRESRDSYGRFLAVAENGTTRAQGTAFVRQAQAQLQGGDYRGAVASYRRALPYLPQIADWLHMFAASAAASAGDTLTVESELASTDSALRADWGWRARLRARRTADNVRAALAIADSVANHHHAAAARAEANARAGELLLQSGDSAAARLAYLGALREDPASSYALEAARTLAGMPLTPARDQRLVAQVLLHHGDLDRALASYRRFLSRGTATTGERLEILEETGRTLFDAGRYADAETRLLAFAAESHDPARAAAALYTAARAQYRDGRRPVAVGTLRRLIDRFPTQTAAASAAYLLADLAHDVGSLAEARARYRQATVLAPGSEPAGLARMRLAGIAFARRDYQTALQHYQAYLASFPNGPRAAQARYWAALSELELGHQDAARQLLRQIRAGDPFSYYSVRAADRLGENFWNVTVEPSPARNPSQQRLVTHALARLELLNELGWDEAARFELGHARRHFAPWDGALYALAEGLIERGFTRTGIAMGWDLYRREGAWNIRLLRIIYPFPYQQMILAEADERNVDPFLAAGIIRQESMFDPHAVSAAGAIGLMQLMPATARALASTLAVRKFQPGLLERPDVNLHLGMAFLADQLHTWNARVVPVLAAYNAGPARVARWRALPEWGRDELFTERIPYQETRDYVKTVQRNAALYRALYATVIQEPARD